MPNFIGVIRRERDSIFTGTFGIGDSSHRIIITVTTPVQSIEFGNVTLTYQDSKKVLEECEWAGEVSKNVLHIEFRRVDSMTGLGSFETAETLPVRINGTVSWERTSKKSIRKGRP